MNSKTKESILKFFRNNGIVIIFRYIDSDGTYNKKYNIISDGEINEYNNYIKINNSTISCNIIKELKVVFIETLNNNNIVNIFDPLRNEFGL